MAEKDPDNLLVIFGIYGAVGFQLALAVVGGLLLGHYLDGKFGTGPWLTIIGLTLGAVGGLYNLIRILKWQENRRDS